MSANSSSNGGGNIIKHTTARERLFASGGVVKRHLIDARAEAKYMLAEAEAEASSIRESAKVAAEELREAAYREGLETALLELNQHLLEAREMRDTALADAERDLLRLAVRLAEKIIGREIERDNAALGEIVSTALRHARQHEMLTVRVNPADLTIIQTHREKLDPSGRVRFLDIVPDPRVAHGGCVIESESGTINAQLETQLRVLERALLARAAGDER